MTEVSVGELFVRLVVSLGVVVGVMAASAWALKRLNQGGLGARARAGRPVRIEVLGRQTLGRRSSVVLIRAGDRGMVLGVTDQNVTLLAETDADDLMEEAPGTVPPTDDLVVAGPPWRNFTESLRERTVRRS